MSDTEKVGLGRPLKTTRWRKGRSGNPKGRPKSKSEKMMDAANILAQPIDARTPDGKTVKFDEIEAAYLALCRKSLKGHKASLREAIRIMPEVGPAIQGEERREQETRERALTSLERMGVRISEDSKLRTGHHRYALERLGVLRAEKPQGADMTKPIVRKLRCSVYTRKSSEEGLEQEFNSLHAQREACEAYITSQRSAGWVLVRDQYDDGGISSGTLDRRGLKRLLADVEDGLVDVVVVYKIDRLSRSLMDFSKLVEVFDRKGVTFVSVTQSFNTTTSMGRLSGSCRPYRSWKCVTCLPEAGVTPFFSWLLAQG